MTDGASGLNAGGRVRLDVARGRTSERIRGQGEQLDDGAAEEASATAYYQHAAKTHAWYVQC